MQDLFQTYIQKKPEIEKRLSEFKQLTNTSAEKLFEELAFCLCTPQSSARAGDLAIRLLKSKNLLLNGRSEDVAKELSKAGVRFNNNKAKYIVEARKQIPELKNTISKADARKYFVSNVKGLGCKEASHFLRNIGLGEKLAILDRHILKNMVLYKVIGETPKAITPKLYFEIEKKFLEFARQLNIPPAHLDLLLWSKEAGEIFK